MTSITYTEANPLKFEDEALYLIEGILAELQIARTTVNLLEKIESNVQAKSMVSGAAAVAGGMHGLVANSAAIALYDGEDTYNFAGLLDKQVVCGSFQHADKIQDGQHVKAVVSKRGEVLFTHAIMNARTNEFYMPLNVFSSSDGLLRHCMRVAMWASVLGWIVLFGTCYSQGLFDSIEPNVTDSKRITLAAACLLFPPVVMFPFELWTYFSMRGKRSAEGDSYGGAIFKVFGFPKPNKIDLMGDCSLSDGANGGWYAAWRGDKLLKKLGA
jgi:hypothetical protein